MKESMRSIATRQIVFSFKPAGRVAQKGAPAAQSPKNLAQKVAPPFPAGPKMRPNVRPGLKKALPLSRGSTRRGRGFLKTVSAEGGFLVSFPLAALKRWQNSEKTGVKPAIFGQKTDKTEQRGNKKGKGTDKLGIRNNTYKTAFLAQKPGNSSISLLFYETGPYNAPPETKNQSRIQDPGGAGMNKRIGTGLLLLSILFPAACGVGEGDQAMSQPGEKIRVMLLDGQMIYDGHKWAETSPVFAAILASAGRFDVEVVTSPERGRPNDEFCPNFADYDVIVANYEGDPWSQKTMDAFEQYMRDGGGLVVIHAADNAFPDWPAWNEMIGFGGWGGRDEQSGPMIWWDDGKIKYDESPGPGGYHGANADWPVTVRDPDHPIMKGLPTVWLHCCDELYSKMRGPGQNMHVLATGRQSPDQKGTGRDEICLFTVTWGDGRIFHTTMGHDVRSISCVGFITTLQRGTEWAATGKVMRTEVPDDFPTAETTSTRDMTIPASPPENN